MVGEPERSYKNVWSAPTAVFLFWAVPLVTFVSYLNSDHWVLRIPGPGLLTVPLETHFV